MKISYKSFIIQMFLLITLCYTLLSFVSYFLDSYRIFNVKNIKHFNQIRPYEYDYSMRGKIIKSFFVEPQTLIIGSSRAEIGIKTNLKTFENKPVMNVSYPLLRINDARRYLEHLYKVSDVKDVYIGLDFLMFNALVDEKEDVGFSLYEGKRNKFNDMIFLLKNTRYFVNHLISWDVLKANFYTLFYSIKNKYPNDIDKRSSHKEFGHRWKLKSTKSFSQKAIFLAYETYYMFGDMWLEKKTRKFSYSSKNINSLEEYEKILKLSHENDVKLHIFISPSHARLWSCLELLGLYDKWNEWKKHLVSINEKTAKLMDKKPYKIVDFSGYNEVTTEKVPKLNDYASKMKNYIDSSHFSTKIGGRIIKKLSLDDNSKDDFGVLINSNNIEKHIKNTEKKRNLWQRKNKKSLLEIFILYKDDRNKSLVNDPFLNISQ